VNEYAPSVAETIPDLVKEMEEKLINKAEKRKPIILAASGVRRHRTLDPKMADVRRLDGQFEMMRTSHRTPCLLPQGMRQICPALERRASVTSRDNLCKKEKR
jgi:hypothetical protein